MLIFFVGGAQTLYLISFYFSFYTEELFLAMSASFFFMPSGRFKAGCTPGVMMFTAKG